MPKNPHELAGQKIANVDCPECKKPAPVKVNKNGIAYFFCRWPDNETGEICNHQTRYSRRQSERLIAAFRKPKPKELTPHEPIQEDDPRSRTDAVKNDGRSFWE